MRDQASKLRNLVNQSMRSQSQSPPPRLLVVLGGKGGVGTTTIAVNLAVAMSLQGSRVVLVDAGIYRADVATMCGLSERRTVADVLAEGNDIHEVLQRGPGGILVVPGLWAPDTDDPSTRAGQERMIEQFQDLGRHADYIVVDAGHGSGAIVNRFCQVASEAIVLTTPDDVAIVDAYASIKTLLAPLAHVSISLLINQAISHDVAVDVHERIDRSCRQFVNREVDLVGWLPQTEDLQFRHQQQKPLIIEKPDSRSTEQLLAVANRLTQSSSMASRRAA